MWAAAMARALEAAKAMHIGNVKIVSEGDARKALYGDKELGDAIKEWAGGESILSASVRAGYADSGAMALVT